MIVLSLDRHTSPVRLGANRRGRWWAPDVRVSWSLGGVGPGRSTPKPHCPGERGGLQNGGEGTAKEGTGVSGGASRRQTRRAGGGPRGGRVATPAPRLPARFPAARLSLPLDDIQAARTDGCASASVHL